MEGVRLHEIRNPDVKYCDGTTECAFDVRGFRPVTERKTDISVFKRMLTGAPNLQPAETDA
jgi:hypothetical protein